MKLSKSQEDYLKVIWYLERDQVKATPNRVALEYGVKPPTVLAMFKQLSRMDLIEYEKSRGAGLTTLGDSLARKLVRKHRLIETFLEKVLEMDGQSLHSEAEKLEHVMSDALMHQIDRYLGFPEHDPHGSPIPGWNEVRLPVELCEIKAQQTFKVHDIQLEPELVKFYLSRDFSRGSTWTLQDKSPDSSVYTLVNGKAFLALSGNMVSRIKVIPL